MLEVALLNYCEDSLKPEIIWVNKCCFPKSNEFKSDIS